MYSKEFMKFLFDYQKDDFKQKSAEVKTIKFSKPQNGKLAEVTILNESSNK